jgi:serine protease Do
MAKKIAAVLGGVVLGLVIAFARAGAFPFWGSGEKPNSKSSPAAAAPITAAQPAQANAPEPGEKAGVITSFAPLVKRVMPTVVNVSVVQEVKTMGSPFGFGGDPGDQGGGPPGMPSPFEQFRRFFGEIPRQYKQHGLGSGVIVSPDGYILTNNHVVGGADEIHVILMDKREFTAKVIGKDAKTDLALIKINTKDPLPSAQLGDSAKAQVGDWVIAIGNPFGFSLTVTAGIVSAKGRILGGSYDNFIQTDASINPGNSGGPLFNSEGQVIGINTAIYSSTGANNGIGFAIPIDLARNVMDQLKQHGRVIRGWLGVEIQQVTPDLAQSWGGGHTPGGRGGGGAGKGRTCARRHRGRIQRPSGA